MRGKETSVKERIINAALEILGETDEIEKITVRQIAERAEVGIGSINYHFQSKDQLLSLAVKSLLADTINSYYSRDEGADPKEKLKEMLKAVCNAIVVYKEMIRFTMSQEILTGNMQPVLLYVPLLKEIFGERKSDTEIRILALQLIRPLQAAGIAPDTFQVYSGFDLFDEKQRDEFVEILVDNVLKFDLV